MKPGGNRVTRRIFGNGTVVTYLEEKTYIFRFSNKRVDKKQKHVNPY